MGWLAGYARRSAITLTPSLAELVSGAPVCVRPSDLTGLVQADLDDAVFTAADGETQVPHYWESKVLATAVGHARYDLPAASPGALLGYLYTGNAGATDTSNAAGTVDGYTAWLDMSGAGPNFADMTGNYPGVAANIETYNVAGAVDGAARFNGSNSNVNLGDVTQLNSASAFTLSFWMAQDVLDRLAWIVIKVLDATHQIRIYTSTDGSMACRIYDGVLPYGLFDYGAPGGPMQAGVFAHIAWVFDGTLTGNANRLKALVNGLVQALSFSGVMPAATANLATVPVTCGAAGGYFDGILDGVRLHQDARTASDILAEYQSGAGTLLTLGDWELAPSGFPRRVLWTPRGPDQRLMQPGQVFGPRGRH